MPDAFVSYSTADTAQVNRLVASLERRGLSLWMAPRDISPGTDYSDSIIGGLQSSRSLIVFVSHASLQSRHVRSEVERAANLGHPIFPIRLDDSEIKGGLEFFISLSQWISLPDTHEADALDRLAEAIKSSKPLVAPRRRSILTRPAILAPTLTLLGLVAAVVYFGALRTPSGPSMMTTEEIVEQSRRTAALLEQDSQRQRQAENARQAANLKFTSSFQYSMDTTKLSVHITPSHTIEGVTLHYSLDGTSFAEYLSAFTIDKFSPLKLIYEARRGAQVVARHDATPEMNAWFKGYLSRKGNTDRESFGCDAFRCSFRPSSNERDICNPFIREVRLGINGSTRPLDRSRCGNDDLMARPLCAGFKEFGSALRPGEVVRLERTLVSGEELRTDIKVAFSTVFRPTYIPDADSRFARGQWSLLEGSSGDSSVKSIPLLGITYTPPSSVVATYDVVLVLDDCSALDGRTMAEQLQLDLDGKGLLPIGRGMKVQLQAGKLPTTRTPIRAAVLRDGRTVYGPFTYDFDPERIVRAAFGPTGSPQVRCTNAFGQRQCRPENVISWMDVASVGFGQAMEGIEVTIPVELTMPGFIGRGCHTGAATCDFGVFRLPKDWGREVYSVLTFSNGSKSEVRRHQLQ